MVFTESWLKTSTPSPTKEYKVIDVLSDNNVKGKGIRLVFRAEYVVEQIAEYK
jgi:hypothetical protein